MTLIIIQKRDKKPIISKDAKEHLEVVHSHAVPDTIISKYNHNVNSA